MRVLIQRVKSAEVVVDGWVCGKIGPGLLLFFGVHHADVPEKTTFFADKVVNLRIFSDEADKMNLDIKQVGGGILVVSQFTLYGNCMNGRRPDFIEAAPPQVAEVIYKKFVQELEERLGAKVETGKFGAKMEVSLVNDGPVTFLLEK